MRHYLSITSRMPRRQLAALIGACPSLNISQMVPASRTRPKECLIRRSRSYILVDGRLMCNNANTEILLKCIPQDDTIKLLEDIHAGSCGNHVASRTLVGKAFRAGFYWPSAVVDAEKLVRHCEGCQFFAKRTHIPAYEI